MRSDYDTHPSSLTEVWIAPLKARYVDVPHRLYCRRRDAPRGVLGGEGRFTSRVCTKSNDPDSDYFLSPILPSPHHSLSATLPTVPYCQNFGCDELQAAKEEIRSDLYSFVWRRKEVVLPTMSHPCPAPWTIRTRTTAIQARVELRLVMNSLSIYHS